MSKPFCTEESGGVWRSRVYRPPPFTPPLCTLFTHGYAPMGDNSPSRIHLPRGVSVAWWCNGQGVGHATERARRFDPRPIRYDTIRYVTRCYFNVRSKADMSQLNRTARKQQLKSVKQKKTGNSLGQAVRTHMCLCHHGR